MLNQIERRTSVGNAVGFVPAIFGMNFQAVSVGQKLAKAGFGDDPALKGGYLDAIGTPGNALNLQLAFVDDSIGQMVNALRAAQIYNKTEIIVSAKHAQSPINLALRRANQGYVRYGPRAGWLRVRSLCTPCASKARGRYRGCFTELGCRAGRVLEGLRPAGTGPTTEVAGLAG